MTKNFYKKWGSRLCQFDMINDPVEAAKWLEKNRPDYREIVNRTIEEMKAEIRINRHKIISPQQPQQ